MSGAEAKARVRRTAPPSALRVVARYTLFQIPELAIVGCVLVALHAWQAVSFETARLVFLFWIAKDVVMFPAVRKAYAPHDGRLPRDPRGEVGVAPDGLDEAGYVRIGPERWRARRTPGSPPIAPGHRFHVVDLDGLTLLVEAHEEDE